MFDPTSRYCNVSTSTLTVITQDGKPVEVRYLQRRFIPAADDETTLLEHVFSQGERLDIITAQYLGDPTQFWHVCDANVVMRPEDLEWIGKVIKITLGSV